MYILTSPDLKININMPVKRWIKETFNCFTMRVCNTALRMDPCILEFAPDRLKIEYMCSKDMPINPYLLRYVPDCLKTQEMCDEVVRNNPYSLKFVPDHLKTKDMCDEAVVRDAYTLEYVPDNLKTQEMCIRQWIAVHGSWSMFSINLRQKKCVKGLLKIAPGT